MDKKRGKIKCTKYAKNKNLDTVYLNILDESNVFKWYKQNRAYFKKIKVLIFWK